MRVSDHVARSGRDNDRVRDFVRRWFGPYPDPWVPLLHAQVSAEDIGAARRNAHVADPTWTPPIVAKDQPPMGRSFESYAWPAWVEGPNGYPIGSRWRLSGAALIVVPASYLYPTLVPLEPDRPLDRYVLDAGTELVLVETHDEAASGLDVAITYQLLHDFSSRIYQVASGPSSGVVLGFAADWWSPFPFSSTFAHALIVPIEPVG